MGYISICTYILLSYIIPTCHQFTFKILYFILRYLETTTSKGVPIYTSKNKNCTAHTKIAFMKTHKTASRYLTLSIDFTFSYEIENSITTSNKEKIYLLFSFFLAQFKIYYSVMVLI